MVRAAGSERGREQSSAKAFDMVTRAAGESFLARRSREAVRVVLLPVAIGLFVLYLALLVRDQGLVPEEARWLATSINLGMLGVFGAVAIALWRAWIPSWLVHPLLTLVAVLAAGKACLLLVWTGDPSVQLNVAMVLVICCTLALSHRWALVISLLISGEWWWAVASLHGSLRLSEVPFFLPALGAAWIFHVARVRSFRSLQIALYEAAQSASLLRQVTDNVRETIWMYDLVEKRFVFVNPAFEALTGYSAASLLDDASLFPRLFFEDDREWLRATTRQLRDGERVEKEHRLRPREGSARWVRLVATGLTDARGRVTRIVGLSEDITERKATRSLLEMRSLTDGLTGLANRRALDEALAREWRRQLRAENEISLILLDVDHFKAYNDGYGHLQGDECLRRVGTVVGAAASRSGDVAARYGGEELAILLPETDSRGAVEVAESVLAAVRGLAIPHEGAGEAGIVTVSLGVATLRARRGFSVQRLIEEADAALYTAKRQGRDRVVSVDVTATDAVSV